MSLTLLIDLDDTLLSNDINLFQKAYFKRLADALQPWVFFDRMMAAMMSAVQAMITKRTPAGTMEDQFDQIFYPGIGTSKGQLRQVILEFYAVEFPKLRKLTSQRMEAISLIDAVMARGWQVVIATNPLFPKTAIDQRLEWAGFSSGKYHFTHVTTYEEAHFCKPHPAYYAEILGGLGWPDNPVVMVGNSLEDDILPFERVGLPTYWLHDGMSKSYDHLPISSSGPLRGILPWLEMVDMEQPRADFHSQAVIDATLRSTPAVMDGITRQLEAEAWSQRPANGEWNVIEILAHLRDVDREVNAGRIESTIRGENPFLPGTNTDPWVQERNYAAEPGPAALEGLIQSRTHLLELIDGATDEQLAQPARHAIFGPTTLRELLGFIATHDRTHIRQAMNAIKAVA